MRVASCALPVTSQNSCKNRPNNLAGIQTAESSAKFSRPIEGQSYLAQALPFMTEVAQSIHRSADGVLRIEKQFEVRPAQGSAHAGLPRRHANVALLRAQELLPDQIDALQNLAEILAKTGQSAAASSAYRPLPRCHAHRPEHPA